MEKGPDRCDRAALPDLKLLGCDDVLVARKKHRNSARGLSAATHAPLREDATEVASERGSAVQVDQSETVRDADRF